MGSQKRMYEIQLLKCKFTEFSERSVECVPLSSLLTFTLVLPSWLLIGSIDHMLEKTTKQGSVAVVQLMNVWASVSIQLILLV